MSARPDKVNFMRRPARGNSSALAADIVLHANTRCLHGKARSGLPKASRCEMNALLGIVQLAHLRSPIRTYVCCNSWDERMDPWTPRPKSAFDSDTRQPLREQSLGHEYHTGTGRKRPERGPRAPNDSRSLLGHDAIVARLCGDAPRRNCQASASDVGTSDAARISRGGTTNRHASTPAPRRAQRCAHLGAHVRGQAAISRQPIRR
jgi:hypothetical protein